jgi:hypothetical protein
MQNIWEEAMAYIKSIKERYYGIINDGVKKKIIL